MSFENEIDAKIEELQKKYNMSNSDVYIALRKAESRFWCAYLEYLRKRQPMVEAKNTEEAGQ